MRVALLIDRFDPRRGGAERALLQLAEHLLVHGHGVDAFAEHGPADGAALPFPLHRVRARRPTRGSKERVLGKRLVETARGAGCDVLVGVRHLPAVDLYWPHGGSHLATLAALRDARGGGRRAEPRLRGRHRAFVELERALLEGGGARLVACPSTLVRDELASRWPRAVARLRLAPNGVDLERFHPRQRAGARALLRARLGLEDGRALLVLAARNPWLKGLRELGAALESLLDLRWMLLVAGPARPGPIERWARRRLGPGRVAVRSEVDSLELAAGADLALLPTWRDACGLVLLEALAAGTPVLTTRRAGAAEVLGDPEAGTVIESPAERAQLEHGLRHWLARIREGGGDPDRVRMAVAGRGLRAWMERIEGLLRELAAPGG